MHSTWRASRQAAVRWGQHSSSSSSTAATAAAAAARAAQGAPAPAAAAAAAASSPAAGAAWRQQLQEGDLGRALARSPALGVIAGIFGSVAGSGGAAVIAPLISKASPSIPQRVVAGTSLAAVLATALTSTATFTSAGCLDPPASLLVCAPAVLFAPLGAKLATKMDCAALKRLLGYFLLAAAPLIPLKSWLFAGRGQQAGQAAREADRNDGEQPGSGGRAAAGIAGAGSVGLAAGGLAAQAAEAEAAGSQVGSWLQQMWQRMPSGPVAGGLLATGAAAGFASGLLGIGGGTVATPMVALLMPFGQATVLGTTLLAMIPPTAVGLLQHYRLGNIHWGLAGALAAGATVGAVAGSTAAVHSPPGVLEGCFTLGMLALARMTLRVPR